MQMREPKINFRNDFAKIEYFSKIENYIENLYKYFSRVYDNLCTLKIATRSQPNNNDWWFN